MNGMGSHLMLQALLDERVRRASHRRRHVRHGSWEHARGRGGERHGRRHT